MLSRSTPMELPARISETTPTEASLKGRQQLCDGCRHFLPRNNGLLPFLVRTLASAQTVIDRILPFWIIDIPMSALVVYPYQTSSTFGEMLAREDCPWCQYLADVIRKVLDAADYPNMQSRERVCYVMESSAAPNRLSVRIEFPGGFGNHWLVLCNLPKQRICRNVPLADIDQGRILSPDTIKQWFHSCQKRRISCIAKHEFFHSSCQPYTSINNEALDLTLIDVHDRCLVPGNTNQKYLTLSYVWGRDHSFLQAKMHNVSKLHKKQALTRASGVPTLIDDAIDFTKSIGERYLWVDSLCLVQDETKKKHAGIDAMHIVYARAYVTIVAASAKNAFSPLSGFRRDTRAPLVSQEIDGRILTRRFGDQQLGLGRSIYATRAWTMQEFMLSSRCLIFAYDQIYYRCNSALQSEMERNHGGDHSPDVGFFKLYRDYESIRSQIRHVLGKNRPCSSPCSQHYQKIFPDFCVYTHLVYAYTERELSYQSDILNAFHAMQSALSDQMNSTFEFGLPMAALSMALLWIPKGDTRGRRRLEDSAGSQCIAHSFPSWSWIGWQVPIGWISPLFHRYASGSFKSSYDVEVTFDFDELVLMSECRTYGAEPSQQPTAISSVRQSADTVPVLCLASGLLYFDAETISTRCFSYFLTAFHEVEILIRKDKAGAYATDSKDPQAHRMMAPGSVDNETRPDSRKSGLLGRGLIYGLNIEELQTDDSLGLVAMSSFRRYPTSEGHLPGLRYHFNEAHGEKPRDLPILNCLVIKWYGDYAERVGVAQIGCLAWRDAEPTVKSITLR